MTIDPNMPPPQPPEGSDRDLTNTMIIYGLYVAGFFMPLLALAGLIFAYFARGNDPVADSHFAFQIRTFWIGLGILFVSAITLLLLIGYVIGIVFVVWTLIRIITGFLLAQKGEAVPNPETWGFVAK